MTLTSIHCPTVIRRRAPDKWPGLVRVAFLFGAAVMCWTVLVWLAVETLG